MYSLLFLGSVAFLLALILTPLARNLCVKFGYVDHPGDSRRVHAQPVPRIGGVPVAISVVGSLVLLVAFGSRGGGIIQDSLPFLLRLLPSVVIIFATGLLDDLLGLKPWQKLLGQLLAAGVAFWGGVTVHGFGGYHFYGPWSFVLTVAWLVLCTNAVNLIDGVDGLATGVGLFAACTTLIAALVQNNFTLAAATIPLVGALAGFLRYNFNPATIFLGDSGSLLLGFLLGAYGVIWSQKAATILGMTAPLMALAIPLMDTAMAVVRRFLNNKPIWSADRGHIHHRLLDRGLTPRKVVLSLYGLCSVAAILSLALVNPRLEGLALVVFCAAAWIGIQHLGYVELGVAGRMFVEGAFRRQLSSQIALQTVQNRLQEAPTIAACWPTIEAAGREFGFSAMRLVTQGETYEFCDDSTAHPSWKVNLSLSSNEAIEFTRPIREGQTASAIVTPFVEMLARVLPSKLAPASAEIASAPIASAQAPAPHGSLGWYAKKSAGGQQ